MFLASLDNLEKVDLSDENEQIYEIDYEDMQITNEFSGFSEVKTVVKKNKVKNTASTNYTN